jgi:hypothetical protein
VRRFFRRPRAEPGLHDAEVKKLSFENGSFLRQELKARVVYPMPQPLGIAAVQTCMGAIYLFSWLACHPPCIRPAAAPLGLEQASANFRLAKAKMLDRQSSSMPRPFAGISRRACETRLPRPSTYLFDRLLKTE